MRGAIIVALLSSGLLLGSAEAGTEKLSGWRAYHFGMTKDEALALSGMKWAEREGILNSIAPIPIAGLNYTASIRFLNRKLFLIELKSNVPRANFAACSHKFELAVTDLERDHGGLVPRLSRNESVTWLPFGSSVYSEKAYESLSPSEGIAPINRYYVRYHSLGAWRWFGDSVVEVQAFQEQPSRFAHQQQPLAQDLIERQSRCEIRISYSFRHFMSGYNIPAR